MQKDEELSIPSASIVWSKCRDVAFSRVLVGNALEYFAALFFFYAPRKDYLIP